MEIVLQSFFWHIALLILSKTSRDDNYVHSDSEYDVLMWLMSN